MRVAIACQRSSLSSDLASQFGRAAFFHIYDTASFAVSKYGSGPRETLPRDAGVDAATVLLSAKVDAVIAGDFGQRVSALLRANHVRIVRSPARSGSWALDEFLNGRLSED